MNCLRLWADVIGNPLGVFDRAAFLSGGGNAGHAEDVIADQT
jgi:hypothetical protein